jgi:hypothetical protein
MELCNVPIGLIEAMVGLFPKFFYEKLPFTYYFWNKTSMKENFPEWPHYDMVKLYKPDGELTNKYSEKLYAKFPELVKVFNSSWCVTHHLDYHIEYWSTEIPQEMVEAAEDFVRTKNIVNETHG